MSYKAPPVLRTQRLTLRPLEKSDAQAIADGVGNYDVSRWLGPVPYPYDLTDAHQFLDEIAAGGLLAWGIVDRNDDLIGVISIGAELGYWLARPAWRKGFGFEAALAVVGHWFADPDNGTLTSGYFVGNERSRAILEAVGFEKVRDRTTFAMSLNQEVPSVEVALSYDRWRARQGFTIQTDRLVLRPMIDEDAPAYLDMAVPEVTRGIASIPNDWSLEEAVEYIRARRYCGVPNFNLTIEMEGRVIGSIGIGGAPVSVMYFLHPDVWGQGLATEALQAFLERVFDRFPLARVMADHFEDNPASGRVLEKAGFVETGRGVGYSKGREGPAPLIEYVLIRPQ